MNILTKPSLLSILAPVALLGSIGGAALAANGSSEHGEETYEWTAYLVEYDAADQAATVSARVVGHADIADLDAFEAGDRLILTWSGRQWAAGIRDLARAPEPAPELLTLPIEFVASEDDGETILFRVPVPDAAVPALREFDPGTALTATSPRTATEWESGVVALRHYNDVS